MWNWAVEEVSNAFENKDYYLWTPQVLIDLFAANGIDMSVIGIPEDHAEGEAVTTPETFGFGLSQ